MFNGIRKRLDNELRSLLSRMDKEYRLSYISPLLTESIKEFLLRKGKRIRPLLFVFGYLGFSKKAAKGLYRSALCMELLHGFMLIHDDIIDKSLIRRGRPAMHALLNNYLKKTRLSLKFSGEDLAIVLGDVIYAMAINALLSIKEDLARKEKALRMFVEAAMYTGSGEFIELIYGMKELDEVKKEDIYKVYDYKTAYYSFASPLAMGAILAGATDAQADKLFRYGVCLGRAFQIKDDLISFLDTEKETGKPSLSDLQEGKKTLPLWHAFKHSSPSGRKDIEKILGKKKVLKSDLFKMRRILMDCGSVEYARKEIMKLIGLARSYNAHSGINLRQRLRLEAYCSEILKL